MKVGDLIKVKNRGMSIANGKKYPGHIGIITEIARSEMNDDDISMIIHAMIDNSVEHFLPRHIKVIK